MSIQHLSAPLAVGDESTQASRAWMVDDDRSEEAVEAAALARALWGSEPPYLPSVEDDASYASQIFFTWVYDIIVRAAAEQLSVDTLHPVQRRFRIWQLGSSFSAAMLKDLQQRDAWKSKIGCTVSRNGDPASIGVLVWCGYAQRSPSPHRLMVGVEWSTLPRIETNRQAAGEKTNLHSGTVYGEPLFDCAVPDKCTLELPANILWVQQQQHLSGGGGGKRVLVAPSTIPHAPSCWKTLFRNQWRSLAYQLPPKVLADAFTLMTPVALEYFVKFLQSSSASWEEGLLLVGAIFIINLVSSVANHKYYQISIRSGLVMRGALLGAIFEKVFTISGKALTRPEMSTGRLVNMVSGDVERVNDFNWYCCYMYSAPAQLIVSVGLLYRLVGWCAFAGVGAMVLLMPAQGLVVRYQHKIRNLLVKATDQRVKATNELFSGIRIVKYMGWEKRFVTAIDEKRRIEIAHLRSVQLCRVLSAFISVATPTIVIATVFVLYHVSGHRLTPEIVFPTISLLGIMRMPFMMIPMLFTALVQFSIAMTRITKFFECDNTTTQIVDIEKYFTKGSKELAEAERTNAYAAAVLDNVTAVAYLPRALAPVDAEAGRIAAIAQRLACCCCCCKPGSAAAAKEKQPLLASSRQQKKQQQQQQTGDSAAVLAEKKDADNTTYVLDGKPLLHDVSLSIPQGKLTVIVGPTGAGKSTLLELLIGQFEVRAGRAYAEKSIAYVPQQPWIMNATVEQNILFFSDVDPAQLQAAIAACQLDADLATFASGLQTEIGEKGVNLSGGQRARVSMARALYAKKRMYLLDDPLSALDAAVGEKLLKECILGAPLAGTTRVLATHHMHVIHHADHVIVLDHGKVAFQGSPQEYEASLAMGMSQSSDHQAGSSPLTPATRSASDALVGQPPPDDSDDDFIDDAQVKAAALGAAAIQRSASTLDYPTTTTKGGPPSSSTAAAPTKDGDTDSGKPAAPAGQLMSVEEKAIGSVPWPTYMKYFQACGGTCTIILILSVYTITEVFNVSSSIWLSIWSVEDFSLSQDQYLAVYIGVVSLGMFAAPLRAYFGYSRMRAGSLQLHDRLLRSVACGTMSFFDTTPLGRILNRFAKDIDMADNDLQMSFLFLLQILFNLCSSLCVTIATQPFVVIPLIPCTYFYYRVLLFFNSANREVVRIGNVLKSPVFALLSESLGGVRTILAYSKASVMMREATVRLERVFATSYMQNVCNRWLGIRVEFVGNVIITSVALASVIGHMLHFGSRNVGMMALGLTLSMNITQTLNWVVRQLAAVESHMNSIERILFYTEQIDHEALECMHLPSAAALGTSVVAPHTAADAADHRSHTASVHESVVTSFRSKRSVTPGVRSIRTLPGSITFSNVCLRYRETLPLVLNDLSFAIAAGEKVGIVGRTGSGKSTLLMAFLRIVDICQGSIRIGAQDIGGCSIDALRKQFAMIPQDPLLFEGTIASNIDPFDAYNDDELWQTVDLVGMRSRVESEAGGLEGIVLPGGTNFSVGQRQLLCMARALLKSDAAFILMDEATANIDPELDKLIQLTVRKAFQGRTVITIAHRLHTILAYDTILVMDAGKVVEKGSPKALALNPDSVFRAMIASHGPQQERKLLKLVSKQDAASSS